MLGIENRPYSFKNLIGQKEVSKVVTKLLQKGKYPSASAFIGASGCGKSTSARIVAMTLNCENPIINEDGTIDPCCECAHCKDVMSEQFTLDTHVLNGGDVNIEVMRQIEDKCQYSPMMSNAQIFIFEEAQLIKNDAFKNFLTLIEKPFDNVYFILTSTDTSKFNNTYGTDNKSQEQNANCSRLARFAIKPVTSNDINDLLFNYLMKIDPNEKLPPTIEDVIILITEGCKNNIRQALNDFDTIVNGELYTVDEAQTLLNYQNIQKEIDTLYKMATKDKTVLEGMLNNTDLQSLFIYWWSILCSWKVRDTTGIIDTNRYRENGYQAIVKTGNLNALCNCFQKISSLNKDYFDKYIFINELCNYLTGTQSVEGTAPKPVLGLKKPLVKKTV